jgi:hypothetical protein
VAQEEQQSKQIVVYLKEFFVYHTAISKITILQIQWNLSNSQGNVLALTNQNASTHFIKQL